MPQTMQQKREKSLKQLERSLAERERTHHNLSPEQQIINKAKMDNLRRVIAQTKDAIARNGYVSVA